MLSPDPNQPERPRMQEALIRNERAVLIPNDGADRLLDACLKALRPNYHLEDIEEVYRRWNFMQDEGGKTFEVRLIHFREYPSLDEYRQYALTDGYHGSTSAFLAILPTVHRFQLMDDGKRRFSTLLSEEKAFAHPDKGLMHPQYVYSCDQLSDPCEGELFVGLTALDVESVLRSTKQFYVFKELK